MDTQVQASYRDTDAEGSSQYPAYQYAADNHAYTNGSFAFTDPSTWGQVPENVGMFLTAAAVSGGAGFYNTGVAIANWFGADAKQIDVGAKLAAMDSELGAFYDQHKQGIDMTGFVVGSLIPGIAGVKAFNAGQTVIKSATASGLIGKNLSAATGLLVPATDIYRATAAVELAQSSATFTSLSGNTLKAIAAGYGQAALESAAFETAVAATLFKSPVLDDADGWDIAKNIAIGTITGGVIGGAFSHAATMGFVNRGAATVNPAEKLFTAGGDEILNTTAKGAITPAQKIIYGKTRLADLPQVPTATEFVSGVAADGTPLSREFSGTLNLIADLPESQKMAAANGFVSKFSRLRSDVELKLATGVRSSVQELTATKDPELGNLITDLLSKTDKFQTERNFTFLDQVGRIGDKLNVETAINKDAKDLLDLTPGAPLPKSAKWQVGYINLYGERAGQVSFQKPTILGLADTAPNSAAVDKIVSGYHFRNDRTWSALADKITHEEVEARYIALEQGKLSVSNGMVIGEHDLPMLEEARKLFQRGAELPIDPATGLQLPPSITLTLAEGKNQKWTITSGDELATHLQLAKDEVITRLTGGITPATARNAEEVAKIANVRESYIQGIVSPEPAVDLFARQLAKEQYVTDLKAAGIYTAERERSWGVTPGIIKASYKLDEVMGLDGNVLRGMSYIKTKQAVYQAAIDNIVTKHAPAGIPEMLWHPDDATLLGANRTGGGPGIATSANGNYGTVASWAEQTGSATAAMQKALKDTTNAQLESAAVKLATKQEAAIEFETVNKQLAASSELYGFAPDGKTLLPRKVIEYNKAVAKGREVAVPTLAEGTKPEIKFTTPEALEAWQLRSNLMGKRTQGFVDIRTAQGFTDARDPLALRPIRYDTLDYPHFALVVDDSIRGVGHKSMIYAADAKSLEQMINKVPPRFMVLRKDQMSDYFKAHGEFDWEKTIHENYIDSSLKSAGVSNPFFIRTDPQLITKSWVADHLKSDDIFARELINAKFEKEFQFFREQGEQYAGAATSRYTGSARALEAATDNPYAGLAKTALNINRQSEHPLLSGLNTYLDRAASIAYKKITDAFGAAKTPADLELVNTAIEKAGISSAYYDAATNLLANHTAPKGDLARFVRGSNSLLSTLTLRLDPLNAINNIVGANVLYGTEAASVMRNIAKGNSEAAGKLAQLTELQLPGVNESVRTGGRLMRNALANFVNKEATTFDGVPLHATTVGGKEIPGFYTRMGWDARIMSQFHSIVDDLTLTGAESSSILTGKLQNAFKTAKQIGEAGETWSGNKFAESFNRFIAADTMRQITDIGVQHGILSKGEQLAYINTFVNRTQGNIIASQRPLMFQGPVGQAIGLFQSYQFNLLQQLFRHVAEGSAKDTATLLGLQGTLYGLNGLPAFNAINTHIVGTASGNPQHTDLYSSTYGIVGKAAGDLLLYGLPSNLLQANLYTRGDINPRQVTVVPTNPADVPLVGAYLKSIANTLDMAKKIGDGGNVAQTILQGVEHNGISRPLAGIAQISQSVLNGGAVFSTTSKGSMAYQNDVLSWPTAARLVGGKPLDEGIVNDATFRFSAYQAADHARLNTLGEAVRSTVIAGNTPTAEQVETFVQKYAAAGGTQKNFNRWMLEQLKTANTPQANKIMQHLQKPGAQNFQEIMGGRNTLSGSE